ncbi:MAG: nucleoside hydrolase [Eubacterium sp.]|nr:nucleoside hydrolase [Eubacterium sp.]
MKITKSFIAIVLIIALLLCACGPVPSKEAVSTEFPKFPYKKIIIDTDTGADDASAIILAAMSKSVDILGVTTLVGNVDLEQSTKNALMALEIAGSDAPVYRGAATTYSGREIHAYSVYGQDGMGDADLIHPKGTAQEKDAVSFILETVAANPGEVEIVSIGPATNIANAIDRNPETMKKVRRIWSMGTSGLGPGNATPVAEFNVYHDAEAYRVMLESGIPITVVGLDVCGGRTRLTDQQFEALKNLNDVGYFIATSFRKLREFDAANGSPDKSMDCDGCAMMCCLDPDFTTESIPVYGSCITEPGETYGQVIFYKKGFTYDVAGNDYDYHVALTENVDRTKFYEWFRAVIQE